MALTHDEPIVDRLQELMAAHPRLFEGKQFQLSADLPSGWYAIADALCTELERILGDAAARFQPIQSKEKWSSWRFYWSLAASPDESNVHETPFDMDIIGARDWPTPDDHELAPTVAGVRLTRLPTGQLRRAVHARVRAAEEETARTCMWCGAPGQPWTNGWVHTACDAHRRLDAITLEHAHELAEQRSRKETGDGDGN